MACLGLSRSSDTGRASKTRGALEWSLTMAGWGLPMLASFRPDCEAVMAKSGSPRSGSRRFPGREASGALGTETTERRPSPHSGGSADGAGRPGPAPVLHAEHRAGRARRHPRDAAGGEEVGGAADAGGGGEEAAGALQPPRGGHVPHTAPHLPSPQPSISQEPPPGLWRARGSRAGWGVRCGTQEPVPFAGPARGPAHQQSTPAGGADRAAGGSELRPGRGHTGAPEGRERGRSCPAPPKARGSPGPTPHSAHGLPACLPKRSSVRLPHGGTRRFLFCTAAGSPGGQTPGSACRLDPPRRGPWCPREAELGCGRMARGALRAAEANSGRVFLFCWSVSHHLRARVRERGGHKPL